MSATGNVVEMPGVAPPEKQKAPMIERITDAQERERVFHAQRYLQDKFSEAPGETQTAKWSAVATAIGKYDHSSFESFSKGTYPANPMAVVAAIERAMAKEEKAAGRTFAPQFVETSITRRIRSLVEIVATRQKIGLLYGQAGMCKTRTFQRIVEERPAAYVYVRSNKCITRPWHFLYLLHRAITRSSARGIQTPELYEVCASSLRQLRKTLIVDEAQGLGTEILDTIRGLMEDGEAGVVIGGNDQIYESRHGAGGWGASNFTQFRRRITATEHLRTIDIVPEDVVLIAAQALRPELLADEDLVALLVDQARAEGGFGRLVAILEEATTIAGTRPIARKHVAQAAKTVALNIVRGGIE